MLDAHDDLPVPAAQVRIAVPSCVELGTSPQGLAGPRCPALAGMADEQHGGFEATLEVSQEAEDGGDLGDGVLIHAVQAHQGSRTSRRGPMRSTVSSGRCRSSR